MAKVFELINNQQKYEELLGVISNTLDYAPQHQLTIYEQFPKAKQLATMGQWNACGRRVLRGRRAIRLNSENGAIYLFDISQTYVNNNASQREAHWSYNKEYNALFSQVLCNEHGIAYNGEDLELCIDKVINHVLNIADDNSRAAQLRNFAKISSEYVILSRLGIDISSHIFDFSMFSSLTEKEFASVIITVNSVSRSMLKYAQDVMKNSQEYVNKLNEDKAENSEHKQEEHSIQFGLFGNGITAYDISRIDKETNDYPTVAHISSEGVITTYDDNISAEDMERIKSQAEYARKSFMDEWNKLSVEQQYQRLLDRADVATLTNISSEPRGTLSSEAQMKYIIEKYMPFVFFKEGERPKPNQYHRYKIYQLPNNEKYHGVIFESMEQLKKDGIQLNQDDYVQVYEDRIAEFKGVDTLEDIYKRFNTNLPADFSGHSLSVSDVIVISVDGKESAYYCDSIGFVDMPDFFRKKELSQDKSSVQDITFIGNNTNYEAVTSVVFDGITSSFGSTIADGNTLSVVIKDNANVEDVRRLVEAAQSNDFYLNVPSAKFLESKFGADFMQKSRKNSVAELEVGDVIMYDGSRREVESISNKSISLKNFDAPDLGGVLLGTSDVLAYDGWQEDMERKGFEIISKSAKDEHNIDLMSDAAEVEDIVPPVNVEPVVLEYQGNVESIEAIEDKALSVGATCTISKDETYIVIQTDDIYENELNEVAETLGLTVNKEQSEKVEKDPLFNNTELKITDYKVVTIREVGDFYEMYGDSAKIGAEVLGLHMLSKNGEPMVGFPDKAKDEYLKKLQDAGYNVLAEKVFELYPPKRKDTEQFQFKQTNSDTGNQLSLFGNEPEKKEKKQKPKSEFASGPLVDGVQVYEALAAEIDRGTGFVDGKLRVQEYYENSHPTTNQLADCLKKEYGVGGHSGEGKISFVDYDSKGITFSFENGEKFRHSWFNVAVMTEARIHADTYLSDEQKTKRKDNPHRGKVEVGDLFVNKLTREVSEIISLEGALPFYTGECTAKRQCGAIEITENISCDSLLHGGLYRYIGKVGSQDKNEFADDDVYSLSEISSVKNLSQLKKAIKPGMMFEITDHVRPECIGEYRIVKSVNTVDFTSQKLNENGEPTGKELHMNFGRAKDWTFDDGELTAKLANGETLMSFHFIDSLERKLTSAQAEEAANSDDEILDLTAQDENVRK